MRHEQVQVGYAVFLKDGGDPVGSVHQVFPVERSQFVVYIENAGDFLVPFSAVKATHFEKVILDAQRLDADLRAAIQHAHDAEPSQ
jgi:hypothetical protein